MQNGAKIADVCAASPSAVHITEMDMKVFKDMERFMEPMRRMSPQQTWTPPPMDQLHGFPVHTITYHAGVRRWRLR